MSNVYPSWWDDTITIYNKYMNPTTKAITWYRTVLTGCFWKYERNKVTIGTTSIDTDSVTCRIPINSNFTEHYLWIGLTDKSTSFTLAPGDIVIHGNITSTIDEYTAGSRSTDIMKANEDRGCFKIEGVAINVGGGRCVEHYYITGV